MTQRLVSELTENIYDAATGGMPWQPIGEGLIRLVGAGSASLMAGHFAAGDAEILFRGDIPLDAVAAYETHYRRVDLWTTRVAAAVARRPGEGLRAWTSGTLVPDDEFLRSEFYNDFGRRLGLRHVVGAVVPLGPAGVLAIGLHRPARSAAFGRADAVRIEALLPHLRRAMQLGHRLATGSASASPSFAALDALAVAVLVVDADLRVLVANAAAEALAGRNGPIRLARVGGATCVTALRQADTAALAAEVGATARRGGAGGAVPLRDADGAPTVAAVVSPLPRRLSPLGGGASGRVPGRALILMRPLRRAPADAAGGAGVDAAALRRLFGLTQAEAEVGLALAGGATKEAVAARRGARPSTVQTQVRAILAKTGAANLRDFERMLAGLGGV